MLESPMLTSTVAILHDNEGHGEDHYVVRTLNDNMYLDAVMDGVTGRRGWEASQTLADALTGAPLTSPAALLAVMVVRATEDEAGEWGKHRKTHAANGSQHSLQGLQGRFRPAAYRPGDSDRKCRCVLPGRKCGAFSAPGPLHRAVLRGVHAPTRRAVYAVPACDPENHVVLQHSRNSVAARRSGLFWTCRVLRVGHA